MTRASILAEARTVFARKGYAEAGLREIATAAGIKAPSLYAHYSSKDELYQAVYAQVTEEHVAYFDALAGAAAGEPPLERLEQILRGIESYYRDHPELAEFSLRAAITETGAAGSPLRTIFLDTETGLASAVRTAYLDGVAAGDIHPGDVDDFVALYLVVMDGLFLQLTHYEPTVARSRRDRAWTFLRSQITTEEGRR